MIRERIRLRFSKKETLRFIGHRDLLRMMERLLRRSGLPVAMSEGFHPKQRVSYVSALALGMASDDEVMEVLFDGGPTPDEILERLNAVSVDGLDFHEAVILPEGGKKSSAVSFLYEIPLPETLPDDWDARLDHLLTAKSVTVKKANGKEVDLKAPLLLLERGDRMLTVRLAVQSGPEAGVRELLSYLGLEKELYKSVFPCRKETELA